MAPAGFQLDGDADVFTPLGQTTEPRMQNRSAHFMNVVARLRHGMALSQGQEELALISRQLAKQYPDSNDGLTLVPYPLQHELVRDVRPTLWLLFPAVSLVLLIACVNVASMLLTRVVSRQHEFALRLALGAPRGRLLRQCLTESGILGICGGLLGLLLAAIGTRPFGRVSPDRLPPAAEGHVDCRGVRFPFTTSILTG